MPKFLWIRMLLVGLLGLRLAWAEPVVLQGTKNTRDLGGMLLAGGHLRPEMLYRSGALCYLTEADQLKIEGLNIRTLIDLRTDEEITREGPDKVTAAQVFHWPMRSYHGRGAESYRSMILQNPHVLREFFALLARPESYPVMFHCSAGKDRTGILTALLLDALGCPRSLIAEDYMQSLRNSPALKVDLEWLQEVFEAVDRSGGTRAFLTIQGVPAGHLEAIGNILLEAD